jgi:hypothetical protein
MPERRRLEERVAALERGLDGEATPAASDAPDREALAERLDDLEARIDDLEAGLQAVRGYVGGIEHVNETVERRADAALAAVERLEAAPKTPPPIATATREEASDSPDEDLTPDGGTEDDAGGVVERLKTLR